VLAGGVESMSRVSMDWDGGAWAGDPATGYATAFIPQGVGADISGDGAPVGPALGAAVGWSAPVAWLVSRRRCRYR